MTTMIEARDLKPGDIIHQPLFTETGRETSRLWQVLKPWDPTTRQVSYVRVIDGEPSWRRTGKVRYAPTEQVEITPG